MREETRDNPYFMREDQRLSLLCERGPEVITTVFGNMGYPWSTFSVHMILLSLTGSCYFNLYYNDYLPFFSEGSNGYGYQGIALARFKQRSEVH